MFIVPLQASASNHALPCSIFRKSGEDFKTIVNTCKKAPFCTILLKGESFFFCVKTTPFEELGTLLHLVYFAGAEPVLAATLSRPGYAQSREGGQPAERALANTSDVGRDMCLECCIYQLASPLQCIALQCDKPKHSMIFCVIQL